VTLPQRSIFAELEEPSGRRDAMDRAGAFLAHRARSEREVRDALTRSGFEEPVIEATMAKLKRLELIDDRAFSRQWVEERGPGKGLGRRRLLAELRLKGVDRDVAEGVLEEVGLDEEAQAKEVVIRLFSKVVDRPLAQQATRLQQMLLGRGFDPEVVAAAVRTVLPPEGWD
jgi:regulatory protein